VCGGAVPAQSSFLFLFVMLPGPNGSAKTKTSHRALFVGLQKAIPFLFMTKPPFMFLFLLLSENRS
jgi:hypothetical protein